MGEENIPGAKALRFEAGIVSGLKPGPISEANAKSTATAKAKATAKARATAKAKAKAKAKAT
ncbi:MAG: hypothetical protein ABR971_02230, partial [Acidobacteriaceae bacterium]